MKLPKSGFLGIFSGERYHRRDVLNFFVIIATGRLFVILFLIIAILTGLESVTSSLVISLTAFFFFISILTLHLYDTYKRKLKAGESGHEVIMLFLFIDFTVYSLIVYLTGGVFSKFFYLYYLFLVETFGLLSRYGIVLFSFLIVFALYIMTILGFTGNFAPLPEILPPEELKHLETQFLTKSQLAIHFKIWSYLIIGYIVSFLNSKLEKAELEAEIAKIEATQAKIDLKNIVNALSSGLIVFDKNRFVAYINQAARNILNLEDKSILDIDHLKKIHPEFGNLVELAFEKQEPVEREEIRIKTGNNGEKPIGISVTHIKEGTEIYPRYTIVVFQDITEVKEMEKKLMSQERLAAIGEFSASLGHEIKIPLSSFSVALDTCMQLVKQHNLELSESYSTIFKVAREDLKRIVKFADTLQDILSMKKHKPSILSIGSSFNDILLRISQSIQDPDRVNLFIEKNINRDIAVEFDRGHLEQILLNLVSNAFDAIILSEKKRGYIKIVLHDGEYGDYTAFEGTGNEKSIKIDTDQVCIIVEDNGPGIPEAVREKIFQPLFTTKPSGTGLGLSIVKKLVDINGAEIKLYSYPETGTAFVICIKKLRRIEHEERKGTDS